jgi:hypothetical protein
LTVEPLGWIAKLSVGEIIIWVGAIVAFWAAVKKIGKPIKRMVDSLEALIRDWHGVPERRDAAGMLIEPGKPGLLAQVEVLRSQVQNSHSSNLREDLDLVRDLVQGVVTKLDEHIEISKENDLASARVAETLAEFTPMLKELHEQYVPTDSKEAT